MTDSDVEDGQKLENGVIIKDDKIVKAESDYMNAYIMSDNYIYTIKNKNIVTQIENNGWLDTIRNYFVGRLRFMTNFYNFLYGPIADILGITNENVNTFGKGMLVFYHEKDNNVGVRGTAVNFGSLFESSNIKVDAEKKTMLVERDTLFNRNNPLEFSLDGWVGRYGMPLEFLMAVHLSTLKPDLCMDMITAFPTNVNIYLHKTTGSAEICYKSEYGKYISISQVESALGNAVEAKKLGVPANNGDCTCELKDQNGRTVHYDNAEEAFVYDDDGSKCEESEVIGTQCSNCRDRIANLLSLMRDNNDSNFEAYQPYIASVTDHWFRDVYYVIDEDSDIGLVDYDYDYESIYKERWTSYETYPDTGEFKLYELDENGDYKKEGGNYVIFNGTMEEAHEKNIAVAKKAKTIADYSVLEDDLDWNHDEAHNIWLAYEASNSSSTSYQRLVLNEDADDSLGDEDLNLYVKLNLLGSIVQKGEGQRAETNPKIKDMFLQKVYFTYDAGPEKAEAIEKLRKMIADQKGKGSWYQAIPSDCMDFSTTVNGKTYTVADCSSGVSRTISSTNSEDGKTTTQELLNVSSMLENIHTADADYISRDFKELIVELGYYTKEELTDETPRLLAWLVPDTGSFGFPKRVIDKNENEYGTMIHSKGDIDAANGKMKQELYRMLQEQYVEPERGGLVKGISQVNTQTTVGKISQDNMFVEQPEQINYNLVKGIGGSQNCSREDQSGDDGCVALVTVDGVEYKNYIQYSSVYGSECFYWSGQYVTISSSACGPTSCVNILTGYGQDVNPQNTIIGLHFDATIDGVGQFMEEHEVPGHTCYDSGQYVSEMESAFSEGRPFVVLFNNNAVLGESNFWTTGGHFVPFVGWGSDGIYTCDPAGPGNGKRFIFPGSPEDLVPAIEGIWFADIAPDGIKKKEVKPYKGYNGNEAVVSPVTGILLEYGTYSDEKMNLGNGVTEEYRVNVDYKYNSNGTGEDGEQVATNTSTNIPVDKVGYAKILVLDNKTYSIFEKQFNEELSSLNGGKSFVNSNGTLDEISDLDEEKIKEWSDKEKTLYAYKEFAELYEKGEIAGNIVYIDGFVCEYPDEDYPTGTDEGAEENEDNKNGNFEPEGEKIDKDHFKKIKHGDISSDNEEIKTSYIKDDEYKLASKKATEKLNAEATVKDEASPSLYTGGSVSLKLNENSDEVSYDGIFIKEGTVIGRTMTDRELLDKLRDGKYGTYEELRKNSSSEESESEDEEYHIIGNYLRIIMQDTNRDIVEDVEDYIKIDDGSGDSGSTQPYQAQPGDEELLASLIHHENCVGAASYLGQEDAERASKATGYVVVNRALVNFGGHGTTIRDQISAPGQYASKDAVLNGGDYCDGCLEMAKWCLQYDCDSNVTPSGDKMKRNVVFQAGFTQGDGTWWVCDNAQDGDRETQYPSQPWDTFYCYSNQFPEE